MKHSKIQGFNWPSAPSIYTDYGFFYHCLDSDQASNKSVSTRRLIGTNCASRVAGGMNGFEGIRHRPMKNSKHVVIFFFLGISFASR